MLRIGVVAGEASGDFLAGGLLDAIRERAPDVRFEGVAGPRMAARGCKVLYPMDRLAIMGLVEVLGRYRELSAMRAGLARHFIAEPPAVFVGVDAPDFNLGLETRLRAAGIATVHYVSPTVWAWRRGRLKTISRAVDMMLTLFPFEASFYEARDIPVQFVGHPLADEIAMQTDTAAARAALDLPSDGEVIALLPGSRVTEVSSLADTFIATARWCAERRAGVRFVCPLVDRATREVFERALARQSAPPVTLVDGRSREVMAAADVVLLASGTAALEAMMLKRPMVAAYRLNPVSHWLIRRLSYVEHFTLPNLLAGGPLVPEFIQDHATPEALGAALLGYLERPGEARRLRERFTELHNVLRRGANERAAEAVLEVAERRRQLESKK